MRHTWLAALVLACACGDAAAPDRDDPATPPAPATPLERVPERGIELEPREGAGGFIGVVFARNRTPVSSTVAGELVSVDVRVGDRVDVGDVIARIDPSSLQDQLQVARAELAAARAARDSADVELRESNEKLERAERVSQTSGAISAQDLAAARFAVDRARAARERAAAEVDRQKRLVSQLRTLRDKAEVEAPFSGTVAARYVDPGAVVAAGEPIVMLIQSAEPWVRFAVPADRAPALSVGDRVSVRVDTRAEPLIATVRQVAPEIDPIAQMVLIEAQLDPDAAAGVRSGLPAKVELGD